MNQSLSALMTRLTWQNNELATHLQAAEQESLIVMKEIKELEQNIEQYYISPLIINPELEINKLNFLTQQQDRKDELLIILKNHQELIAKLTGKLQRIKIELKMLEQYIEREQQTHKEQLLKIQEQALDEWVLQNRKSQ
ncbi:hypothetical protein [uncultured Legionella sp.]|uniref:hypothetical protein n=1 Tax=uncultured Legionella sp. TaxID=210934 RepID=UPI00263411B9|nr:hypothetical protein [uncultured Legionella sp.]